MQLWGRYQISAYLTIRNNWKNDRTLKEVQSEIEIIKLNLDIFPALVSRRRSCLLVMFLLDNVNRFVILESIYEHAACAGVRAYERECTYMSGSVCTHVRGCRSVGKCAQKLTRDIIIFFTFKKILLKLVFDIRRKR